MVSRAERRRLFSTVLGALMLATVVGAALTPASGSVSAQTSCQYNQCPPPIIPFQDNVTFLLVVLFTILGIASLAVLVSIRNRVSRSRPPPPVASPPPAPTPVEPSPAPPVEEEAFETEPPF